RRLTLPRNSVARPAAAAVSCPCCHPPSPVTPMRRHLVLALAVLAASLVPAAGQKYPPMPPGMSPAESLAALRVRPGFAVELVAAEPLVMDPIDIAWGPDGRLWVVEMADYPLGIDGKGKPGGRVRVLESTRGDGKFDKST